MTILIFIAGLIGGIASGFYGYTLCLNSKKEMTQIRAIVLSVVLGILGFLIVICVIGSRIWWLRG